MITFTAETFEIGWHGLRFKDIPITNDSSKLVYCKVQYGYGHGIAEEENRGGGIAVESVDNLLISFCLITQNKTFGGIYSGGGGVMIRNCSPRITNNLITNNYAQGGHGGGILICEKANPVVSNNIFFNNTAFGGGGIALIDCEPVLINNTITRNYADHGGAVDCISAESAFVNTIMYGNAAMDVGDEVHIDFNLDVDFLHCDIEGGLEAFGHNHRQGCSGFSGRYEKNIDAFPEFLNIVSDFHLSETSLCLGRGIDAIEVDGTLYRAPSSDFFGKCRPRPTGSSPDIGAIEHDLEGNIEQTISKNLLLEQNYPNPFNPSTTIRYRLGDSTIVNLKVFSLSGIEVATLVDEYQIPGEQEIIWNANGLPSGVYLYSLQTQAEVQTRRCVLQK